MGTQELQSVLPRKSGVCDCQVYRRQIPQMTYQGVGSVHSTAEAGQCLRREGTDS